MLSFDLGPVVFETENLVVYAASNVQLLAMKLWAWRDDQAFEDAARLLEAILASSPDLTREEPWAKLEQFLPAAERLDARQWPFYVGKLAKMPRSAEEARCNGPEPLRRRNVFASPNFLSTI